MMDYYDRKRYGDSYKPPVNYIKMHRNPGDPTHNDYYEGPDHVKLPEPPDTKVYEYDVTGESQ